MSNMGDAGINPASQQAYYLPDASGVGNHHEQPYLDHDASTDSSTILALDDYISLSGTTQASEQSSAYGFSGFDAHVQSQYNGMTAPSGHARNPEPPNSAGNGSLSAFNTSVSHPIARSVDITPQEIAVDPRLHRSEITNHSGISQYDFVDFVHSSQLPIKISGKFETVFDLELLTMLGSDFVRQATSGRGLLCGLHALVISLNAKLFPSSVSSPISVSYLQELLAGREYYHLCTMRIQELTSGPSRYVGEALAEAISGMFAPRNLSVEQLTYLVYIVGAKLGLPLQLGVVASTSPDIEGQPCSLYTASQYNCNDNAGATTIWLVNQSGVGGALNHWSGMAPPASITQASHAQVAKAAPQRHGKADVQDLKRTSKIKVATKGVRKGKTGGKRKANALTAVKSKPAPSPPADAIYCPHPDCKQHHTAANPKPFKNKRALGHHQNTVHRPQEQRKHICDICGKGFNYPKDLRRHNGDVHDRDHPQWCLVADCAMYGEDHRQRGSNLWRHYQNVHGDDPEAWELCRLFFGLGETGQPGGGRAAISPAA